MSDLLATLGSLVASLGNVQSAGVARERLALATEQGQLLLAEVTNLRAQLTQAQQQLALTAQQLAAAQRQLQQVKAGTDAQAQRKGWVCGCCGGGRLRRISTRPDPLFGELGAKLAQLKCLDCDSASEFSLNPGE